MGQFLQIILNFLREYAVPWVTVYEGQLGIRWTLGRWVKNLRPGFHFYCPIIQHIETTWACYQEVDTLVQTFTTADGVSVAVSANVGYEVYNAAKYYTRVYNFDSTIERAIRVHLFNVLHALEYEQIRDSLSEICEAVKGALHEQATNWGVRIKRVGMTDFVKVRTFRVMNEVPNFVLTANPS